MKTLKLSFLSLLFILITQFSFSQSVKKETFKVSGECGMCKKKIETAAKGAGASYASWNADSKQLTVKYKSASADASKIQQSISAAGYDTPGFKASDKAYKSLHECCQYDRTANATTDCCNGADHTCCADGKCSKDITCKQADSKAACCKKA